MKFKKFLAGFLSVLTVFGSMAVTAFADETDNGLPNYTVTTLTGSEIEALTKGSGNQYTGEGKLYNIVYNKLSEMHDGDISSVACGMSFKSSDSASTLTGKTYENWNADFEIFSDKDVEVLILAKQFMTGLQGYKLTLNEANNRTARILKETQVVSVKKTNGENLVSYSALLGINKTFTCCVIPITEELFTILYDTEVAEGTYEGSYEDYKATKWSGYGLSDKNAKISIDTCFYERDSSKLETGVKHLANNGSKAFDFSINGVKLSDGRFYADFSDTIAAVNNTSETEITFEVYGKVEVDSTGWILDSIPNAEKISFIGKTDAAELCLASGEPAILGSNKKISEVNFTDLICSRPDGSWAGDYGHSTRYFTTWLRTTAGENGKVTYTNCVFPDGVSNNQYGKTVFNGCEFTNSNTTRNTYNLWVYYSGTETEVEVSNCEFSGVKGVKLYAEDEQAVGETKISDTEFNAISNKPAVVSSIGGTVELNNVELINCQYGLAENEKSATGYATIKQDGKSVNYEVSYNGIRYSSVDYAVSETNQSAETLKATFTTLSDGGYYAPSRESEAKTSFTATFNSSYGIALEAGLKFGMFIYKSGNENGVKVEDFDSVTDGKFTAIVENITDKDAVLIAVPYITDGSSIIKTGESESVTVGAFTKWLGRSK